MELRDSTGHRIAANFVNVATRSSLSPRIEVISPRLVALRFSPIETRESGPDSCIHPGKFWAAGQAEVAYRIMLPDWVSAAGIEKVDLVAELATHAGTAKLDWPWRQKPIDYPQTDVHKYPGKAQITIAGVPAAEVTLEDDPADIRGFLSSAAQFHHASYGYLTRVSVNPPKSATELLIRMEATHGISIYGEGMGRYGMDPVVLVHTSKDVRVGK